MEPQYLIKTSRGEFGPMTGERVREHARSGALGPQDHIRRVDESRWVLARDAHVTVSPNASVSSAAAPGLERGLVNSPRGLLVGVAGAAAIVAGMAG